MLVRIVLPIIIVLIMVFVSKVVEHVVSKELQKRRKQAELASSNVGKSDSADTIGMNDSIIEFEIADKKRKAIQHRIIKYASIISISVAVISIFTIIIGKDNNQIAYKAYVFSLFIFGYSISTIVGES